MEIHQVTSLPPIGMVYIYVLADPRTKEVRYIGKTDNPKERLSVHCRDFSRKDHKTNWLRQVNSLKMKPIMQVVEIVDESDWIWYEKWWIAYGKLIGWRLTNSSSGGEGVSNPSEETRKKKSLANKGKKPFAGHKHTEEWKKEASNRNKGQRNSYAVLTENDVWDIKKYIADGVMLSEIARVFNVHSATIWQIKAERNWGWLTIDEEM